MMIRF